MCALHFACEVISRNHGTFNDCCSLGKVSLDMTKFREFPEYLKRLLCESIQTKGKRESVSREHQAVQWQTGFCVCQCKNEHFSNSGPYVYKIQGQIHHVVNLAAISDGGLTRVLLMVNCSLFIMDTNEAVDARTTADRAIDRNLMFDLETLMRTCNPFVEAYRMMHEVEQEALAASGENARVPEIKLLFNIPDQNSIYGGQLGQSRAAAQRLLWQRLNQKTLKADCFVGLEQHLQQRAQEQGIPRGRTVILSSTFVGGDRQAYQDAMAIVTEFGAPDLFITFTCNPKWPEILKLKEFMDDMLKKQVLGKVKAFVRVIEFQKRGLPHTHMLLILDDEHKFRTGADVDSVVCAELPYPATEPQLYNIVKSSMMHGPCGTSYRHMQCMQKHGDRCDKDFPKPLRKLCSKRIKSLDIAVERSFYRETGAVENEQQNPDVLNHDEVQNYADARYVGPAEASWFELNQNNPSPSAHGYLYKDIPKHFVWNKKDKKWSPRQKGKAIGRIYQVSPTQTECFRLRLLLLNVPGATSYEALRTVRGTDERGNEVCCATMRNGNGAYETPHSSTCRFQMRALFVLIITQCSPGDVPGLYAKFEREMADDFVHRLGDEESYEELMSNADIVDQAEERRLGNEKYAMLNAEQKAVVDTVLAQLDNTGAENRCHFIDGPGGSGKTFVYNTLIHILRGRGLKFAAMAYTGIAAQLLPEGKTIHHHFRLTVGNSMQANVSTVSKNMLDEMDPGDLVTEIFADAITNGDYAEVGKRAILSSKNSRVYKLNEDVLKVLPGEVKTYSTTILWPKMKHRIREFRFQGIPQFSHSFVASAAQIGA
ncbi:hypothetical protein L596_022667 [Steinernema carpocapsae]|uniref:ATP-dependent DNA helicase n=1 Tax=Steinernema carpocapsae TaxID=34508 RepID=A0A4U5MNI4_STECR|nr:hypothetical protein L596_022667 [Steinernema carpocapsae]